MLVHDGSVRFYAEWNVILWYLPTELLQEQDTWRFLNTTSKFFFFFFPQEHTPHYLQDVGQPLCKGQGSGSFTSLLSTQILSPDMSSPRTTIFTPPFILSLVSRYSLSPLALGLQGWPCPTTALPQEVEGGNGRMDSGSEEGGPGPGLQLQYEGGNVAPLCIYTMYLDR